MLLLVQILRPAHSDPFNAADTQTCNYTYDDLSRLGQANCGAVWGQSFGYDAFGNITKTVLSGSAGNSFQPAYSPTNNRITSLPGFTPTYDANGNVTNDSLHTYAWDAENRPITLDGVGLTYDALARMVEQNRSGSYTQIVYSPSGAKLTLMTGQTLQKAFVPLPGGPAAVYTSTGLSYYRHSDWLGNSRLASTLTRTVYSTTAYAPFGENYAQSGTADLSFTGQNQDTTSGSYDFLFREYSTQGRWPSPDPAGLAATDPANPQSWNRYAYVRNTPTTLIDQAGLYIVCMEGFTYDRVDFFVDGEYKGSDFTFIGDRCGGSSGRDLIERAGGRNGSGNSSGSLLTNLNGDLLNLDVCIENNAKNFSVGGVLNLTTDLDLPFLDNQVTSTALLLTGQLGLGDSATASAQLGRDAFKALNKPIMTNGPNSLTTLTAQRGSPQPVLGNGTNHSTSFAGKVGKVLGTAKGIVDVALSGALVVDCAAGQVH